MGKNKEIVRFIDIGANLVDTMYQGVYNGSQKHDKDLSNVLQRAWTNGVEKILVTGTSLEDSKAGLEITKECDKLFATVGCHPTNCLEFEKSGDSSTYLESLINLCKLNPEKIRAVGEFGLDYDRINFCPMDVQKRYFEQQVEAFIPLKLPFFLHCRNAASDLISILRKHPESSVNGVVHSFDGTEEEAKDILDLGLYIGINGCSLKKEENLEVAKSIPSDRILLETDSPWCEIRPTHAGFKFVKTVYPSVKKEKWQGDKLVKGRNEPCNIIQVLEVLSALKEEDISDLSETIFKNTENLFFT